MRFLFDQNISHRIIKQLPQEFFDSTSVKQAGLMNSTDRQVWEFARKKGYIIVTQDSDFNDLTSLYGFPPKIIWIRSGNLKTKEILQILIDHAGDLEKFALDGILGCFEIIRFK
jgi:predicted nuclease of predicted toxin-antitoxin system